MRDLAKIVALGIVLSLVAFQARGEEPRAGKAPATDFTLEASYGLGIGQHRLDAGTEVIGWRLNPSWYVGQREQKGAADGLSLIWQGQREQISFSLDGVRFMRRF